MPRTKLDLEPIDCLTCGSTFKPYNHAQRFCGPDCWYIFDQFKHKELYKYGRPMGNTELIERYGIYKETDAFREAIRRKNIIRREPEHETVREPGEKPYHWETVFVHITSSAGRYERRKVYEQ